MNTENEKQQVVASPIEPVVMRKCASCGNEKSVSEMIEFYA